MTFNFEDAKQYLYKREIEKKEHLEKERKFLLEKIKSILIGEFKDQKVEVYLIGSIIQPYSFYSYSDIDIVLKNFIQDPFSLSAKLERLLEKNIDLIIFEECHFQDFIIKYGIKVL